MMDKTVAEYFMAGQQYLFIGQENSRILDMRIAEY
jgi:hypothetical protein